MSSSFKTMPHTVQGAKYPRTIHAKETPPVECLLHLGDRVTHTNEYGVVFPNRLVTGFTDSVENGRFVYIDQDCWWFPVNPAALTHEVRCC